MKETLKDKQYKLTEKLICNSYLSLLETRAHEKITVADICREAGISRGTFYLHFQDVPALAAYLDKWYIDAITEILIDSLKRDKHVVMETNALAYVNRTLDVCKSWPEFSRVMLGKERGLLLISQVEELVENAFIEWYRENCPEVDARDIVYRFSAVFYYSWGVLRRWIRDGMKESPEYLLKYYETMTITGIGR